MSNGDAYYPGESDVILLKRELTKLREQIDSQEQRLADLEEKCGRAIVAIPPHRYD